MKMIELTPADYGDLHTGGGHQRHIRGLVRLFPFAPASTAYFLTARYGQAGIQTRQALPFT